ncbi:hypothetical protein [Hydrogenimonas thermophila]|uniref:Phage Tail Protein X n=1 Tax=Hydrogenimonas thermophila TaxID=223786 RepID=A0A1I5USB6_9BACT|nr:hypothetical protein [Hydrogenimonas thermophila]SFP98194.1 hypothetical protein SAMN05216234_1703 [Hydrogenimonas thermophila]
MKKYVAKRGERLDKIIFKEYKTLNKEVLNAVLSANKHLLNKQKLDAFDEVFLPEIEIKTKKTDKTLW